MLIRAWKLRGVSLGHSLDGRLSRKSRLAAHGKAMANHLCLSLAWNALWMGLPQIVCGSAIHSSKLIWLCFLLKNCASRLIFQGLIQVLP